MFKLPLREYSIGYGYKKLMILELKILIGYQKFENCFSFLKSPLVCLIYQSVCSIIGYTIISLHHVGFSLLIDLLLIMLSGS